MAFIPPAGDNVVLWFGAASPPAGDNVILWFGDTPIGAQILVYGINSLEFGSHAVDFYNRTLITVGVDQAGFGLPSIVLSQQAIQPPGFSDEALGEPVVILKLRQIGLVSGIDGMTFGTSRPTDPSDKGLRVRSTIGPTQVVHPPGFSPLAVNTPLEVAFQLRYIRFLGTLEMTRWGTAVIDYTIRHIFVPWFYATQMGTPILGYTPKVTLHGFDSSALGVPNASLGNVRHMQGWVSSAVSKPTVSPMRQIITVVPWDAKDPPSTPLVFNKTQIIYVDNQQFFTYYPYFSNYNDVSNRDRHITPESFISSDFSILHNLRLVGQQVLPVMGEMTEWGDTMVSHRIRHVYPDTSHFFAGYFDPYHFVHNAAIQRTMVGIDSLQMPTLHRIWFNAQTIAPRSIVSTEFGEAFVAYNPRYIQQLSPDFGLGFVAGKPWVSAVARPLLVAPWTPPYMFGTPILRSHRNVITAFPITYVDYGVPRVHNATPQLYPSMVPQTGYGVAWVSHSPRTLQPLGIPPFGLGDHAINFRTRTIHTSGIYQFVMPRPTVRKQVDDEVHDQTIWPDGFESLSMGLMSTQPHVFAVGLDSAEFGQTWIRVQGCTPYWDFPDSFHAFGIPSLNATQTVTEENEDNEKGAQTGWPESPIYHRVSPHTIWCRFDTPQQAIDNNPQGPRHWPGMDTGPLGDYPPPPWFGTPSVTTPMTLYIYPWHSLESGDNSMGGRFGAPDVENSKRYIYVNGINSQRVMFPTLPHEERLWIAPWGALELGTPTVNLQPNVLQHIRPSGFNSAVFGQHRIEDFNRAVHPFGFVGTSFGNNNPMVYRYPRGVTTVGADSSVVSEEAWVSFYERTVSVQGFDSFREGYTFGQFNDRMRVTQPYAPPTFSAGDELRLGAPDVSYGKGAPQEIGPYMIPPPELCHPHSIVRAS